VVEPPPQLLAPSVGVVLVARDQEHADDISSCRDVKQQRLTRLWSYHDQQ
jgi:hypothetical protein